MKFIPLETEIFTYQHLLDSDENLTLIKGFRVKEETGKGLENYLKNVSEYDERNDFSRTYLIKDKRTKDWLLIFLCDQVCSQLKRPMIFFIQYQRLN